MLWPGWRVWSCNGIGKFRMRHDSGMDHAFLARVAVVKIF